MNFHILVYTPNKYSNFFQIVTVYSFFAHNINKRKTKVYHKMGFVVSYKIVQQTINANKQTILKLFCTKVNIEQFYFIL